MSLRDRLRKRTLPTDHVGLALPIAIIPRPTPITTSTSVSFGANAPAPAEPPAIAANAPSPAEAPASSEMTTVEQLTEELHRKLLDRLDLEALEQITDEASLTGQIRDALVEFVRAEQTPLSQAERDAIVQQIVWEITGLGPIEPLFRDPAVTDILVNGPREVYVERQGKLTRVSATFRNDAHLLSVIDRIVSRVGRRVDESSPMVDARLPDGSRVNAIIPPLALDGPVLSIRRFGADLELDQLISTGSMSQPMAHFLAACVHARLNVLISGGTGAGKTTLLNALSSFIPEDERLITIEDAAELRLLQRHVVRLETRPPNVEGRGEVVARDLVRNALRMRPNRIIIGEVRGAEVVDMLQAMNTGHEGSLTTIHANSPRDALARLETMVLLSGANMPLRAIREQIASTLNIVVQVARLSDGARRVVSITEVTGIEGDVVTTSELHRFRTRGLVDGHVRGQFEPTGVYPACIEKLTLAGVTFDDRAFDERAAEQPADAASPNETAGAGAERWNAVLAERGQGAARAALQQRVVELETEREAQQSQAARRAASALAFAESLEDLTTLGRRSEDQRLRAAAERLDGRMCRMLAALGLEEIPALGSPFDAGAHDAVRTVEGGELRGAGEIVELVQRGYRIDGRVARKAQVIVTE